MMFLIIFHVLKIINQVQETEEGNGLSALNFKTMVYNPNSRQRKRVSFFLKGGKKIL